MLMMVMMLLMIDADGDDAADDDGDGGDDDDDDDDADDDDDDDDDDDAKIPASCLPSCPGLQKTIVTHPRGCLDFMESTKTTESFQLFTHKCSIMWGYIHMSHVQTESPQLPAIKIQVTHVEQLRKALLLARVGATQNTLPPNCLKVVWRE